MKCELLRKVATSGFRQRKLIIMMFGDYLN